MTLPTVFRQNNDFWNSDPLRRMNQLQRQMEHLFENFQSESQLDWPTNNFLPRCEVEETSDHYVMSLDVPGVKKENIKVRLHNGVLTVSGERKLQHEEKKEGQYRSERSYGSFQRSFSLPEEVKAEQIQTEYKDGVLQIAIPKVADSKAQEIKIGESKPGFFERLLSKKDQKTDAKPVEKAA